MDPDKFKLTSKGTYSFREWAERVKKKWPGNVAFFVGDNPLVYGVSRMYEMKTADDDMPVAVVKTFDELPDDIKKRITGYVGQ